MEIIKVLVDLKVRLARRKDTSFGEGKIIEKFDKFPNDFFANLEIPEEKIRELVRTIYNEDENGFDERLYFGLGDKEQAVRDYVNYIRRRYTNGFRQIVEDLVQRGKMESPVK